MDIMVTFLDAVMENIWIACADGNLDRVKQLIDEAVSRAGPGDAAAAEAGRWPAESSKNGSGSVDGPTLSTSGGNEWGGSVCPPNEEAV